MSGQESAGSRTPDRVSTMPGDEAAPGTPGAGEDVCPACHGSGRRGGEPCPECGGTGRIVRGIGGG